MLNLHDSLFCEYDKWNDALCDHYLTGNWKGRPLYLDMEESVLAQIALVAGHQIEDSKSAFISAVKKTLNLSIGSRKTFQRHADRLAHWTMINDIRKPPFVGLLAFFSLVAESMVSDGRFRNTNYYGRMAQALDIEGDRRVNSKIHRDFGSQSHMFWEALNQYIFASNGRLGMPTAYAFDSRVHVSIPVSQALVREDDRVRFSDLFSRQRLTAGSFPADEMLDLIKDWIPSSSVSSSLRTLWDSSEDVRERIASIACEELQSWDGVTPQSDTTGSRKSPIRLVASIQGHPRPRIYLGLRARHPDAVTNRQFTLQAGSEEAARLALDECGTSITLVQSDSMGWGEFIESNSISIPDLLIANISLRDESGDFELARRAKQIVILKSEPENRLLVEVDRASLAVRHTLLVHHRLEKDVLSFLRQYARPGWKRFKTETLNGCPEGWILIRDAALMGMPDDTTAELQPLVPTATAAVEFAGGLSLADYHTWHVASPPEVSFSLETDKSICAILHPIVRQANEGDDDVNFGTFARSGIISLGDHDIPPGEYRFSIYEIERSGRRSRRATASSSLRLRSAETARPIDAADGLRRPLTSNPAQAVISAVDRQSVPTGPLVVGALVELQHQHGLTSETPPASLRRASFTEDLEEAPSQRTRPRSGLAPPCFGSSAHHWDLGTGVANERRHRLGRCIHCGLEQWHNTWPSRHRRSRQARALQESDRVNGRDAIMIKSEPIAEEPQANLDTLFDAISLLGQGTWRAIAMLALQADSQPWFSYELARNLVALGHLEVSLDEVTLRMNRWTVAPPVLVKLPDKRSAVLAGFRSQRLLRQLKADVKVLGGSLRLERQMGVPSCARIRDLRYQDLCLLAESASDTLGFKVHAVDKAAFRLLSGLPHVSTLMDTLPKWRLPHAGIERFEIVSGRWVPTEHSQNPGAYRTRFFPRTYAFVPSPSSTARIGSPELVKHLESVRSGVPLMAYSTSRSELTIRLGAQLPGLYERVAMLCSGSPPRRFNDGTQRYKCVPTEVASGLWARLRPTETSR